MCIVWFVYYSIKILKDSDEEGDGLLIFPCMIIDAIIISVLNYLLK